MIRRVTIKIVKSFFTLILKVVGSKTSRENRSLMMNKKNYKGILNLTIGCS